jgi:hypothetical protein
LTCLPITSILACSPSQRFQVVHLVDFIAASVMQPQLHWISSDLVKGLAFGKDRPGGSGQLVGQLGHHHALGAALQKSLDPAVALSSGYSRSRAMHQYGPHVRLTLFGDNRNLDCQLCFTTRSAQY